MQPNQNLHNFLAPYGLSGYGVFLGMGVPHGGVPLNKAWYPYVIKLFSPSLEFDELCCGKSQKYENILLLSEVGWENSNFGEILAQKSQNCQILAKNP